jgi:hypothetical protein
MGWYHLLLLKTGLQGEDEKEYEGEIAHPARD